MTVQKQSFVQPVSNRIPVPTTITNVIATLQGTASPERYYVVTGHLDSRVTDVLDFTSDAPGADDELVMRETTAADWAARPGSATSPPSRSTSRRTTSSSACARWTPPGTAARSRSRLWSAPSAAWLARRPA